MKTVLITGGTSGIGKATVYGLAAKDYRVIFLARNTAKAESLKKEIVAATGNAKIDFIIADLTSKMSVRECANFFKKTFINLDVLINNAGVCLPEKRITADGFEETFQINHLSHFLLTNLLLDSLKESDNPRIINVSSGAHTSGKFDPENLQSEKHFSAFSTYSDTKLLNILFTIELSERVKVFDITVNALHPGVVNTNFAGEFKGIYGLLVRMARPFFISPEKGAATSVYLATSDDIRNVTGKYFVKCKQTELTNPYITRENCRILWDKSLELSEL